MSWHDVDLTKINPNLELIPAKKYTFELLPGAKYDDRNPDQLVINVAIVNDGEFSGRRLFVNYKPGEEKALKRLEQAMGVDATESEDPVAYLNRAAGGRFMSGVVHSAPSDEYPNPKAFFQKWNVAPAA
jgi:predicted nucleotidyltransferase